jgi:hypothetical protein
MFKFQTVGKSWIFSDFDAWHGIEKAEKPHLALDFKGKHPTAFEVNLKGS